MLKDVLDRIEQRLEALGLSATAASKRAGLSLDAIRNMRRKVQAGEANAGVSSRTIQALAPILQTTAAWLLEGDSSEPREYTYVPVDAETGQELDDTAPHGFTRDHWRPKTPGAIPELDVEAGAGEGTVGNVIALPMDGGTVSAHEVVDEWPLPATWLREVVNNPGQTIIVQIRGDSMVPNYMPGDRVVVDLSQDTLQVDGVYLISYDMGPPQLKRLQRVPLTVPPKVSIKSDNPSYDTFEVELDLLRIHGRVCAYVGRR